MKKKKIMWFHGMGGEHEPELREFLKKYNLDFFNPSMDYELNKNNEKFNRYILDIADDYEYIAGNSMGGFWAFHVGCMLGKKTILFNPAISDITLSYKWFYDNFYKWNLEIPEPLRKKTNVKIFLSTHDDVVDTERTLSWLKENNFKHEVEWMENHTHSLPLDLIIKNIFKSL